MMAESDQSAAILWSSVWGPACTGGYQKLDAIYRESENHRVRASLLQIIQIVEFFLWIS